MPFESEKINDGVQQALSRFQSVDHLLVRPKLADVDIALQGPGEAAASRISLLDYQELEQKIKNFPADPIPYFQLAQIYDRQLRSKDTMRVLNAGVQHNPEFEPLVIFREELVLRAAQQSLAEAWRRFQQEPSDDLELEWQRAQASLANEQIAFCQSRFSRHPDQKELLVPWAAALRSLGRIEEAIHLLKPLVDIPELRAQSALEIGQCYQESSQPLDALSSYRTVALFRDPPPPKNLQIEALRKAFHLADQLDMIDAAKRYGRLLLECNIEDHAVVQQKLDQLQRKMI